MDINIKATPGESPSSNGIIEFHNAVLGKIMEVFSNKYPTDVIIAWEVIAKNASHTCYCYSPN